MFPNGYNSEIIALESHHKAIHNIRNKHQMIAIGTGNLSFLVVITLFLGGVKPSFFMVFCVTTILDKHHSDV